MHRRAEMRQFSLVRRSYGRTVDEWSALFRVSPRTIVRWEERGPPPELTDAYFVLIHGALAHEFGGAKAAVLFHSLERALDDIREKARGARRLHDDRVAAILEDVIGTVEEATRDYRLWLSEEDATVWTGRRREWLRRRFRQLEQDGHARLNLKKEREYRRVALSRRAGFDHAVQAAARIAAGRHRGARV